MDESDQVEIEKLKRIIAETRGRLGELEREESALRGRLHEVERQRQEAEQTLWLSGIALDSFSSKASYQEDVFDEYAFRSIAAGAEAVLRKSARPMNAREIAEELKAGGKHFKGKTNSTTIVTTTLKRYPDIFVVTKRGGVNYFQLRDKENLLLFRTQMPNNS